MKPKILLMINVVCTALLIGCSKPEHDFKYSQFGEEVPQEFRMEIPDPQNYTWLCDSGEPAEEHLLFEEVPLGARYERFAYECEDQYIIYDKEYQGEDRFVYYGPFEIERGNGN